MKRVLIVTEVFYPENGLINDFAMELANRGFHVEVLTQHPSYPYGRVFDGYANVNYCIDDWNGIKIHRFKVVEGYCESKLKKIANYYKFVSQGSKIAKKIGGAFDHILVYQTGPLTLALPAIALKKKFLKPVTIWTFDIWPDAVYAYGFPKHFPLTTFLNSIIRKVYCNSDNVLVSSRDFIDIILKYSPDRKIEYAPNWMIEENQELSTLQIDSSKINFTFTGNISMVQNLENVILGWHNSGLSDNAILNIVGNGSSLDALKEMVDRNSIKSVVFHGRVPSNQIEDILFRSDVLIMPLIADIGIMKTEPFKMQSYLKAGKSIFGILDGAGREIIEENGLGVCAKPNDISDIALKFRIMIDFESKNKDHVAINAKILRNNRFNRDKIIDKIINIISA